MKKKVLIALILIALLIGGVSVLTSVGRSKSRNALAAYKANLRAQGEKLTFEEAGYPFPLETNANLADFVTLANQLPSKSNIPGNLNHMKFSGPGRAVVSWGAREPSLTQSGSTNFQHPTWEELATDCDSAADILAEIRTELEHPPRYFGWNYANPFGANQVKNPFVQKRKAAQFLAADSLCALHEHKLPRAQTDLHALTQLAQVHRGDWTLVSAMIRVAISGVGLAASWEALPAEGWDENSLLALQRDWEAIDLVEALEKGLVGERIWGGRAFTQARESSFSEAEKMVSLPIVSQSSTGWNRVKDRVVGGVATAYWRGYMDTDELFYIQHSQKRVELLRQLKTNVSGASIMVEMNAQNVSLERMVSEPLGKYQHLFSALAIPNSGRAFEAAVRNETQRRMTITAVALKRFHLQNGHYPAAPSELVPQFIAAELVDPWSGKPFHYRLNADGSFMLYSVGEDGRDDGGDPTSAKSTNAPPDMWSGKDAVWPTPVFSIEP